MIGGAMCLLTAAGCAADHGTELKINNAQLFYTSAVTKEQAEKLGDHLKKTGFFDGTLITCQLNKSEGTWEFRLVVKPGVAEAPTNVRRFRGMARKMSNEVFDKDHVVVHLCDNKLRTLKVADPEDGDDAF
jgi:hypothetical protein